MAHGKGGTGDLRDMITGAGLAITEAMTLGMPLEVWKTRQGAYPKENAIEAAKRVYESGGWRAFFRGGTAKMLEAGSKGAVLLYSKELIIDILSKASTSPASSSSSSSSSSPSSSSSSPSSSSSSSAGQRSAWVGGVAGAGGGIAQTVVMAPLTYVVTHKMKNKAATHQSTFQLLREAGLRKAYGSSVPVALRQASNWALRQGLADGVTNQYRRYKGAPLSPSEQIGCGLVGGALACVNQPFEILRIRIQALHSAGETAVTTMDTARLIYRESGLRGFYVALIPRMCLSAYQTLFMVTFASMVKDYLKKSSQ